MATKRQNLWLVIALCCCAVAAFVLAFVMPHKDPPVSPERTDDIGSRVPLVYEVAAQDGRLSMTLWRLTIVFEGIAVADDDKSERQFGKFKIPNWNESAESTSELGSTR